LAKLGSYHIATSVLIHAHDGAAERFRCRVGHPTPKWTGHPPHGRLPTETCSKHRTENFRSDLTL
jgi:hypothetical protein